MALLGLYPTKKALKEAIGQPLRYEELSIARPEYQLSGMVMVEGPHRDSMKCYAEVTLKDGLIVKVS